MDAKELELLKDFLKQYIKWDQFLEISRSTEEKIISKMKETIEEDSPFLENENFLDDVSHIIIRSMFACIGATTIEKWKEEVEKAKKNKLKSASLE